MMKRSLVMILVMFLVVPGLTSYALTAPAEPEVAKDMGLKVNEFSSIGGGGRLGLAVTRDGKTAYVSFDGDDALFVVDLTTFTTIASIDVSSVGVMLMSFEVVLSPDESRLYVANYGTRNVMIVNTENSRVEEVLPIDPQFGDSISVSYDGSEVYITAPDGLYIVQSSDYSYDKLPYLGIGFDSVEPSASNPDMLYCIGWLPEDPQGPPNRRAFFTFNLSTYAVEQASFLPDEALAPHTPMRFTIDSNETTAYFGSLEIIDDKGVGNLNVFDVDSFQTLVSTPIECGVSDFAINEEKGKVYIIGFWSGGGAPNTMFIREWDMSTQSVTRGIFVAPSNDQRAIVVDPTNADYLYMTEGDFNLLRKVEISTGREVQVLKFNEAHILPDALIRGDGVSNSVGYIVSHTYDDIYKLNLNSGELTGRIRSPNSSRAKGYHQGKLYLAGGRSIYSIDPSDGAIIDTFDIGMDINPMRFTFFNDKMATIDFAEGMVAKQLLLFDAESMTILKFIDLPSEPHGNGVIASPDGSKLYISRGHMGGPTVVTVLDTSTLNVINTLEIPYGASGTMAGDFDETNRILYLCGFSSIYKIDMDIDQLTGILDVWDVYESRDYRGWSCTGLSGVVLSSAKDKLFVISADAHSMYTYDLVNSSWTTKITNLKGGTPNLGACSPDLKYLYTVNWPSDSVTMVDLTSGDVVRIIELTRVEVFLPLVMRNR